MIDEFTRECLVLKADRVITSTDVIDFLAELFAMRGVPKHIRSDNGPELIANELRAWLDRVGVSTLSIEPGSSWENGYAESFHSRFLDECLAQEIVDGLHDARAITAAWKDDYNHRRPNGSWFSDPGRVRRRVCGIRLGQGLGSCRTRGCLPRSDPTLNPHIAWYKKPKPVKHRRRVVSADPRPCTHHLPEE